MLIASVDVVVRKKFDRRGPLRENHLRTAVRAYVAHHLERNHQGLDNRLICEVPDSPGIEGDGSIQCRKV